MYLIDQPYQYGVKPYHAGYLCEKLTDLYPINLETCFCKTGGSQKPAGLDLRCFKTGCIQFYAFFFFFLLNWPYIN